MHFIFGNLTNFHPASCCFSWKSIFVCPGVYDKPVVILKFVTMNKLSHRLDNANLFYEDYILRICEIYYDFCRNFEEVSFFWSDLNCVGETFVTLQAILQSHDEVLKISTGEEVNQYHADTSTGYNGRIEESMSERPEKLTRVRLVQFHKNLNEPMVRMQVHALWPYR